MGHFVLSVCAEMENLVHAPPLEKGTHPYTRGLLPADVAPVFLCKQSSCPASGRPDHTAGLAQRLDAHPRIVGRIDFPSIYYTGTKVESLRPCPDFFAQQPKDIPQST